MCPCEEGNCYNPNPDNPDVVKPINNCIEFPEICGDFGECEESSDGPQAWRQYNWINMNKIMKILIENNST